MACTKTVVALQTTAEHATIFTKVAGAFSVGSFIIIWLLSVASPFVLFVSIAYGFNTLATFLILVTIASYLPWTKGPLIRQIQLFYSQYHACYYEETTVLFEGSSLPSPNDPQTLYAVHPHGAFCLGWSHLFALPAMDHVRFCFSAALFASPFFRLFSRCVGNPGSASRGAMISYLQEKIHIALPPGGFEEATLTCTYKDRAYIRKRTGFIKLCLQYGVAVRPVYVFGEKSLFWNIQGLWKFRLAMNRYGFPMIFVWGRPLLPWLPRNHVKLYVVVGAPLILPKIPHPTKAEVALWHGKYMDALTKLFEDYKEKAYGAEVAKTAKLELW
jgi:diacylglycerol O-acyltransferase 2, plant